MRNLLELISNEERELIEAEPNREKRAQLKLNAWYNYRIGLLEAEVRALKRIEYPTK